MYYFLLNHFYNRTQPSLQALIPIIMWLADGDSLLCCQDVDADCLDDLIISSMGI